MIDSFSLLSNKVQRVIWDMKWTSLRSIQSEAIQHIMSSSEDLIISAPTASGKTEAAFLPIISQIGDLEEKSVSVLYISPLKALINDQFCRITELCHHMNIRITKWHGDADQAKKNLLLKKPNGILLITPESLESLFINRGSLISKIFLDLKYVVIDEVHSFLENSRGTQTHSLLSRIENETKKRPIRVGLSATINNLIDVAKWLNYKNYNDVKIIQDTNDTKEIRGIIKAYKYQWHLLTEKTEESSDYYREIEKITRNGVNLIFANQKNILEDCCDGVNYFLKNKNMTNPYLIHHGSLSKEVRESVEIELKKEKKISVFCTNTLELGIDIGNIDSIIFLQPPIKVSSLIQRLGRSGRKEGQAKEFRFLLKENFPTQQFPEILRFPIVHSIALIELMLENWCEPVDALHFDLSTFIHQILSFITQKGSCQISEIYDVLLVNSFHNFIEKTEFISLLRFMKENDLIQQTVSGSICLGATGEKIVENYHFYASFQNEFDWDVICDSKLIGNIPGENIKVKEALLLAGERWTVINIKKNEKKIIVKKGSEKRPICFSSGGQLMHKELHQKIEKIYRSHFIPPYIKGETAELLLNAYDFFDVLLGNENSFYIPIFQGSRICRTVDIILNFLKVEEKCDFGNLGIFPRKCNDKNIFLKLKEFDFSTISIKNALKILPTNSLIINKFDKYLPEELLIKSYSREMLDFEGTKKYLSALE